MIGEFFHGTLTGNVESILRGGLRPRGTRPAHDEYIQMPSYPEFVYLTDSDVFAVKHIIRISERRYEGAPITILRVDASGLDASLAYPDEDWLEDVFDCDLPGYSHRKQLSYMRHHRLRWQECLTVNRTFAYRGVIKPELLSEVTIPDLEHFIQYERAVFQEQHQEWRQGNARRQEAVPFAVDGPA